MQSISGLSLINMVNSWINNRHLERKPYSSAGIHDIWCWSMILTCIWTLRDDMKRDTWFQMGSRLGVSRNGQPSFKFVLLLFCVIISFCLCVYFDSGGVCACMCVNWVELTDCQVHWWAYIMWFRLLVEGKRER